MMLTINHTVEYRNGLESLHFLPPRMHTRCLLNLIWMSMLSKIYVIDHLNIILYCHNSKVLNNSCVIYAGNKNYDFNGINKFCSIWDLLWLIKFDIAPITFTMPQRAWTLQWQTGLNIFFSIFSKVAFYRTTDPGEKLNRSLMINCVAELSMSSKLGYHFWNQYSPANAIIIGWILTSIYQQESSHLVKDTSIWQELRCQAYLLKYGGIPEETVPAPSINYLYVPASDDVMDDMTSWQALILPIHSIACEPLWTFLLISKTVLWNLLTSIFQKPIWTLLSLCQVVYFLMTWIPPSSWKAITTNRKFTSRSLCNTQVSHSFAWDCADANYWRFEHRINCRHAFLWAFDSNSRPRYGLYPIHKREKWEEHVFAWSVWKWHLSSIPYLRRLAPHCNALCSIHPTTEQGHYWWNNSWLLLPNVC